MQSVTYLGLTAATLTATAFLPQAFKVWKTKKTRDISLWTFVALVTGNILWLIYGAIIKDIQILFTNSVIITLASTIIIFKARYK